MPVGARKMIACLFLFGVAVPALALAHQVQIKATCTKKGARIYIGDQIGSLVVTGFASSCKNGTELACKARANTSGSEYAGSRGLCGFMTLDAPTPTLARSHFSFWGLSFWENRVT